MTSFHRFRITHVVCVALCAVLAIPAQASADPPTANVDVLKRASELGLSPEALVVAGAASTDLSIVMTILQRLHDADTEASALAGISQNQTALGMQLSLLETSLRTNPDDSELALELEELKADIAEAQAELDTLREQLMGDVLYEIPAAVVTKLHIFRTAAGRPVPHEFRVAERTLAEWKEIESALRAEKRSERLNAPLNQQHAALLQSIRSEPAVIQAAYELNAKLSSIEVAFAEFEAE